MSIFKGHSFLYASILMAADTACILLTTYLTVFLSYQVGDAAPFSQYFLECLVCSAVFTFVWFWAALYLDLFRSNRKDDLLFQMSGVLKGVVISLAFFAVAMVYLNRGNAHPTDLTNFGIISFALIATYRLLMCLFVWGIRQWGLNVHHVIMVGANERTNHLVDMLLGHARFGYHIIGVIDDDPERMSIFGDKNLTYLGKFEDLDRMLSEHVVDELHIGLPVRSCYEIIQKMAHLSVSLGVSVRMVADLFPLRMATSRVHRIEDIPMLSLSTVPECTVQLAIKRIMDAVVSAILLVLFAPIFAVVAFLIKMDSAGPVFFVQERVGLNQRRFKMIKFRSMVSNAEQLRAELESENEADGPVFKMRNDPRVTKVGKVIRKTSIDELPQLVNVLLGQMSLVGPRPLPKDEIEKQSWDQRRRLSVKPGMTGLWQVSGRSNLTFKEWVDLDLAYIDTWNIFSDFRILLKTFQVVIQGRGAA